MHWKERVYDDIISWKSITIYCRWSLLRLQIQENEARSILYLTATALCVTLTFIIVYNTGFGSKTICIEYSVRNSLLCLLYWFKICLTVYLFVLKWKHLKFPGFIFLISIFYDRHRILFDFSKISLVDF